MNYTHKAKLIITPFFILVSNYLFSQEIIWEQTQKEILEKMADSLTKNLKPWKVPNKIFKVENYGAIGDSIQLNTMAIQKAIDDCSNKGGGIVLFSKGHYVTGTIDLKSGVMLEIDKKSKILGSINITDYPERIEEFKSVMSENHKYRLSLIYAEKCNNIGIRGKGEIYFRGEKVNFPGKETTGEIVGRPFGIRMVDCKNVVLQDVFLHNSAAWMQSYLYCQNLIFDGIKVINQANYNNDGLDPDGCNNVIVRNCYINSEDDAMCLKGASGMPSKNILIENSTFLSSCNALKIGTDTQGDFFKIVARNLTLGGIPNNMPAPKGHDASTGITLATVDGGNVKDILISNVKINMTRCPIFIRIGNRLRAMPNSTIKDVGYLKNIIIENVSGENNFKQGSLISGIKNHLIKDVIINNYKIKMEGGGDSSLINNEVPEKESGYPDAQSFLKTGLPSMGFYVRYAENINITNAEIIPQKPDKRPIIMVGNDVKEFIFNGQKNN
jgi:polygalacturonase